MTTVALTDVQGGAAVERLAAVTDRTVTEAPQTLRPPEGAAPGDPLRTGPQAPAEASRSSFRDAFALPQGSAADNLGHKVLDRLDRIQRSRLEPSDETGARILSDPTEPKSRADVEADAVFDRQMRLLEKGFNHAIEVELAAKTGTGLASSMNKLMSGN